MAEIRLDRRAGGVALLVGYATLLAVLFRDPAAGPAAATASLQGGLYFLVLPAVGILAGAYAVLGGSYSGIPVFVAANYLAVFGLSLSLGLVSSSPPLAVIEFGLFVLAVVALVASLRGLVAFFRLGSIPDT